jgi:hypothetical protein
LETVASPPANALVFIQHEPHWGHMVMLLQPAVPSQSAWHSAIEEV